MSISIAQKIVTKYYDEQQPMALISREMNIPTWRIRQILVENGISIRGQVRNRKYKVPSVRKDYTFLLKGYLRQSTNGSGDFWRIASPDPKKLLELRSKLNTDCPIRQETSDKWVLQVNGKEFVRRVKKLRKELVSAS